MKVKQHKERIYPARSAYWPVESTAIVLACKIKDFTMLRKFSGILQFTCKSLCSATTYSLLHLAAILLGFSDLAVSQIRCVTLMIAHEA